jgi:hypothetical protein
MAVAGEPLAYSWSGGVEVDRGEVADVALVAGGRTAWEGVGDELGDLGVEGGGVAGQEVG